MNITLSIESGNYEFNVELNLGIIAPLGEVEVKLMKSGLRWELERGGLSEAWKEVVGVAGKRGGKVLPEGFKRDSVEYVEDKAEVMKDAVESWGLEQEWDLKCEVGEYVKGEVGEAMKQAKAYLAKQRESGKMAKLMAILELPELPEGQAYPDSELVKRIHLELFKK
jgi:hypothetical protein